MKPAGLSFWAAVLLLVLAAGAPLMAAETGPSWNSLTPAQRQVLAPLQRDWASIDAGQREKWIEVAAKSPTMPPAERQLLQTRMTEWARMSPAERAGARQRFQEVKRLPAEERQARWQAYQALSPEERSKLAQSAKPAARAASDTGKRTPAPADAGQDNAKRNIVRSAPAVRPRVVAPTVVQAGPGATTTTMSTRAAPPLHHQTGLPKIAATPGFVDPATLLPQRGPQGAAVQAAPAAAAKAGKPAERARQQ